MSKKNHLTMETNKKESETIIFDEETHNNQKEFEKLQNQVKEALGEEKSEEIIKYDLNKVDKYWIVIILSLIMGFILPFFLIKTLGINQYTYEYNLFGYNIKLIKTIWVYIFVIMHILSFISSVYFLLFFKVKYIFRVGTFLRAKDLKEAQCGHYDNKLSFQDNLQIVKAWLEKVLVKVKNSEKNIVKKGFKKYVIIPYSILMLIVLIGLSGIKMYLNHSLKKDFKILGLSQEQIMNLEKISYPYKAITLITMKNRLLEAYTKKYGEKCGFDRSDLFNVYFMRKQFKDPIDFVKGKCSHKAVDSVYNTYDPDKAVKELGYELIPDDQDIKLQEIRKYKEELKKKEETEKAEKE